MTGAFLELVVHEKKLLQLSTGSRLRIGIMRRTVLLILLILIAATLLPAAYPSGGVLARLTIVNHTDRDAYIRLRNLPQHLPLFYFLTARPGITIYTVTRAEYRAQFRYCGVGRGGRLDLTRNTRLIFVSCGTVPCVRSEENVIKIFTRRYAPNQEQDEDEEFFR